MKQQKGEAVKKLVLLKRNFYRTGGLEKYARCLAEAFAQAGFQVTVLTTGPLPQKEERYRVLSFYQRSLLSVFDVLRFDLQCRQWLEEHPTDLVFGLDRNSFQTHYRAGSGSHITYLKQRSQVESLGKRLSFSMNPLHRAVLKMERKAYESKGLKVLFTNSQMVREEILSHYHIHPEKVQVVHNGVEWHQFHHPFAHWRPRRREALMRYQLDPSAYQLLFVGSGYQRKGLHLLLEALAETPCRDFQLSVVGKDRHCNFYKEKAKRLGLGEKVRFFGPQRHVIPFYQIADSLVIPSLYDPFANVTLEALAMGVSVVSSKYNGGSEILTRENGTLIDNVFDRDSFVEALEEAFLHPKDAARALHIRNGVEKYDFSQQLSLIVDRTANSLSYVDALSS